MSPRSSSGDTPNVSPIFSSRNTTRASPMVVARYARPRTGCEGLIVCDGADTPKTGSRPERRVFLPPKRPRSALLHLLLTGAPVSNSKKTTQE